MLEVYYECVFSIRAELFPAYLILILVTLGPIIVSLPLFSGRSLFRIRKPVKCLSKPCLFTTWSNIALPNFLGASVKLAGCSRVIFLIPRPG